MTKNYAWAIAYDWCDSIPPDSVRRTRKQVIDDYLDQFPERANWTWRKARLNGIRCIRVELRPTGANHVRSQDEELKRLRAKEKM